MPVWWIVKEGPIRYASGMPSSAFPGQVLSWLETSVLPDYLRRSRWFGDRTRELRGVSIIDTIQFCEQTVLFLIQVDFAAGPPGFYQVPLAAIPESPALAPESIIAHRPGTVIMDALHWAPFREALWNRTLPDAGPAPVSRVLNVEQSHSALLYGGEVFLKIYRRIEPGPHPEREILEFLAKAIPRPAVPLWRGSLEWNRAPGAHTLLALATAAVPHQGTAWEEFTALLDLFFQEAGNPSRTEQGVAALFRDSPFPERLTLLGKRVAGLHLALARGAADPGFSPEPLTTSDLDSVQTSIQSLWAEVARVVPDLETATRVRHFIDHPVVIAGPQPALTKIRTHGDLHLGQVLHAGNDFVIIDFEGEPTRPTAWRRRRQSPVRDVAGMVRSLHYAAASAGLKASCPPQLPEIWTRLATTVFLETWHRETAGASFSPNSPAAFEDLLQLFLLEKVLYEIQYEAGHRPEWLPVPLRGLRFVLDQHP